MDSKKVCSFMLKKEHSEMIEEIKIASKRSKSNIMQIALERYYKCFKDEWKDWEKTI